MSTAQQQPVPSHHTWCWHDGTVSWWLAAEQRCSRDAVSETGAECVARYCVSVLCQ